MCHGDLEWFLFLRQLRRLSGGWAPMVDAGYLVHSISLQPVSVWFALMAISLTHSSEWWTLPGLPFL